MELASLLLKRLEAMFHHICWIFLAAALGGCVTPRMVALRAPATSDVLPAQRALHVIPYIDDAADPLPLQGESVVFAGVASTLADAIGVATQSWAQRHQAERPGGWELRVDLIHSRAEAAHGRITVELATRVTLSATIGQMYLAQTHGYCQRSDVLASDPTATVYGCMEGMARDLAGWLEGVRP
jgi:hypothetical protein